MATEREENLLLLIEVLTKEVSAIGQTCSDARWIRRYELAKFAQEEGIELGDLMEFNAFRDYDDALKKAVDRTGDVIRLSLERVRELTAPREREGA